MVAVGLDFGTAFARAALIQGGKPRLVQHGYGARAGPAVVALEADVMRIGGAAVARAATRPATTVRSVKRLLGRAIDDPIVLAVAAESAFTIEPGPTGSILLRLGTDYHEPEDLAAALLRHLADTAAAPAGGRPTSSVLAVPTWFGARQRRALVEAARRAGIPAQQVISEAAATALTLAVSEKTDRRIAIVDVGAGGTTVSILRVGPGGVAVLASAGEPNGGDDLDRDFVRTVVAGLRSALGPFEPTPVIVEMVRQACERMKRDLGEMARANAVIPFLPLPQGPVHSQAITIERARFEPLLAAGIQRLDAVAARAIEQLGVSPDRLEAVYATGGVAHTPAVRAAIERRLGKIESRRLDPDGAVALGAALMAAVIAGAAPRIPLVDLEAPPEPVAPPKPAAAPPPEPSKAPAPGPTKPPPDPTADAVRGEIASLLGALRAGRVRERPPRKTRSAIVRVNDIDAPPIDPSPEDRAQTAQRLGGVFRQVGIALQAIRQYRATHPHAQRALAQALDDVSGVLAVDAFAATWDVSSTHFACGGVAVWQPDRPPLDRIPYQLFADGVRKVQIKRGITVEELSDFLGILTRDPAGGFGMDDSAVTALWERRFEHIAHLAVESFAEGEEGEREAFERQCEELASHLSALDLDGDLLADAGLSDVEVAAIRSSADAAAAQAQGEALEAEVRRNMELGAADWMERQGLALLSARAEAGRAGDDRLLAEGLAAWSAELLAGPGGGAPVLEALQILGRAFTLHADEPTAAAMELECARVLLPDGAMAGLLAEAVAAGRSGHVEPALVAGLARALELRADASLFRAACDALVDLPSGALRDALRDYVITWLDGHERELGRVVAGAESGLAYEFMTLLAERRTPAAIAALEGAFSSPHVEIRMAALAAIPDLPAARVRDEVSRVLDDTSEAIRLEALRVIGDSGVVAAGPVLVHRIQSPAFHDTPLEERRATLHALGRLNPRRAEEVAVELLEKRQLIRSQAVEETREICAELLGSADSPAALRALQSATGRLFNAQSVRAAAARAVAQIVGRQSLQPPPGSIPPARNGSGREGTS